MERNIYTKGLHLISAYRDVVYCHPRSGFRIVVTVGEFDDSVEIFDEKVDPMFHFQNAYVDLSFSDLHLLRLTLVRKDASASLVAVAAKRPGQSKRLRDPPRSARGRRRRLGVRPKPIRSFPVNHSWASSVTALSQA
jgi:hypothetical protein